MVGKTFRRIVINLKMYQNSFREKLSEKKNKAKDNKA